MSEISPKKRKLTERNEGKDTGSIDKFSNLPLVLIHDILSIIPLNDAVKTCVLSKEWRTIWASRPVFYFSEPPFELNREAFLTYLEKSLDSHEKYGYTCCEIREFSLNMKVEKNSRCEFLAKKCFDFACRNKVRMFKFRIRKPDYRFCLPRLLQLCDASYFSATLDSLEIQYCEVKNCSFVFPALKLLRLGNVLIEDDDFGNLIAGCPVIEGLRIERCRKLVSIVVSNPNLKHFLLDYPCGDRKIRIESRNLESFSLSNIFTGNCKVEITSKVAAKRLILHNSHYRKSTLMCLLDKFPLLEELHLDDCIGIGSLYVSQQNMTSFVLRKCYGIKEIRIDAPKLKSLEYTGGNITSFTGMKSSKELEIVKLHLTTDWLDVWPFDEWPLADRWYIWLRNILESFAHSKHLSLNCCHEKVILFPDELTKKFLPTIHGLKNLEVHVLSCNATTQEMLDHFIRIFPGLKTFSLTTFGSTTELIEVL